MGKSSLGLEQGPIPFMLISPPAPCLPDARSKRFGSHVPRLQRWHSAQEHEVESVLLGTEFQPCQLLAGGLWPGYSTSLCLIFFICKMVIILVTCLIRFL